MLRYVYISTNFEFCFGIGIREHFCYSFINTVKFSEKFLMCDCYLFLFMLFSAKTEDGYSTGNEKIAIR